LGQNFNQGTVEPTISSVSDCCIIYQFTASRPERTALTIRNKTEERIQGYEFGADIYLPKPFELNELGAAIHHLLKRAQMIQSEQRLSYEEWHRCLLG
jgi:DNA-binding response OmpR family regulator